MNKNPVLYKSLVVGVIILFVGVGIQPAFAVSPDTSESEDDCNLCAKKVSKSHLILIESLLNRVEKSKDFDFGTSYLDSTDICDKLEKLLMVLVAPLLFLEPIIEDMDEETIIFNLLCSVYILYGVVVYVIPFLLYFGVFKCDELPW